MEKMTLGKELSILFKLISTNSISIVALILLVLLAIVFITTNKKTAKFTKYIYLSIYTIITVFIIIVYNKYILDFIDYLMNNLFVAIYFPNLAIYFGAIIISNIIALISIFNLRITKLIRNINIIMFSIINFLLILLVGVITDHKLDIYSLTSIYDNRNAHALIELTSILFILWMIFLIIYRCIRIYQINKYGEKETVKVIEKQVEKIIEKPVVEEKIVKERILPENIVEVSIPNFAKQGSLEIALDEKDLEYRTNIEVEKRINTKIREAHAFDKMLTKDDYIVLLNLLKQNKNKPLEKLGEDKVEDDFDDFEDDYEEDTEEEAIEETTIEETKTEPVVVTERLGEEKVEDEEEITEEIIEETEEESKEETEVEIQEEEPEYYDEPKLFKILDDDQSSYIRLQELYESVNL